VTTHLDRWGNSLGIRVPRAVAEAAGLKAGDRVDISVEEGRVVIQPARPRYFLDDLLAGVTPENEHPSMDDLPVGRERFWEAE
jgi:antitoxin MazE